MVDLPALGKHLDRCLSTGQYMRAPNLHFSRCKAGKRRQRRGVQIPQFLRGLYLLVFSEQGVLKDDYDVQAISFLRQILYVAKKACLPCSDEAVRAEVREFLVVDAKLPVPDPFWDSEAPTPQEVAQATPGFGGCERYSSKVGCFDAPKRALLTTFLANLDVMSGIVSTTLGPYVYGEWRFRHGPGAIAETTGPSNKYSTCWHNWAPRLDNAFPISDCGYHSWRSWVGHIETLGAESKDSKGGEPYSRLVDVPKTLTKPRLIAAEPSAHQWCQHNIWHYFCERTRATWLGEFVRFRDQTRNQELCVRGSEDGSLATVDLSAASDRVSCLAVAQLFRRNPGLLAALQASRTRLVKQTQLQDVPELVKLRKFSTMGSAVTFPVESLMFLSVVLCAVLTKRRRPITVREIRNLTEEVAIFGDDIVVPEDSRELLFDALEVLDFKVNLNKSFWNGKFRESCGVDSFGGVNVTPVYWKRLNDGGPESFACTVEVANNFYQRWLVKASAYMESTNERYREVPIVPVDSGVCGYMSFVRPTGTGSLKTRFNKALQRHEVRVHTLQGRVERTPITDDSALLQFFTEEPHPSFHWKGGVAQRPATKVKLAWIPGELVVG